MMMQHAMNEARLQGASVIKVVDKDLSKLSRYGLEVHIFPSKGGDYFHVFCRVEYDAL